MKKIYILMAVLCPLAFSACGNGGGHKHDGHNHEQLDHDDHDHDHDHAHGRENESEVAEIVLSPERAREAGVRTATIEPGPFSSAIRSSGKIEAAGGASAVISARTSGILSWAGGTPAEGRFVSKGETIARVSAAGMGEGDAVTRATIAYETAKKEYERAKLLLEDKIISEREFNAIEAEYRTALNAWEGISSEGGAGGVSLNSPLSGRLGGILKEEGSYVNAGEAVASVFSDGRLRLVADLPVKYASLRDKLRGINFKLHDSDEVHTLGGRPSASGNSLLPGSAYIPVSYEFDNVHGLLPGSIVEVWLLTEPGENVISVPESALTEEQGEFFVYVKLDEECYKKQAVSVGGRNGSEAEILSGLVGGEDVVVEGAYQVKLSAASVIPGHTHNH